MLFTKCTTCLSDLYSEKISYHRFFWLTMWFIDDKLINRKWFIIDKPICGEKCWRGVWSDERVDREYRSCYFRTCFAGLYLGAVSVGISDDPIFAFDSSVDETPAKDCHVSLMDPRGGPDGMPVFREWDIRIISGICGKNSGADQTQRNAGDDQQPADAYIGGRTHRGDQKFISFEAGGQ